MRWASLLFACVPACITSVSAFADSLTDSLTPNVTLGLQFGGGADRGQLPMHFTALLDMRSQLLRRDPEMARSSLSSEQSERTKLISTGVPLLTVFQFGASKQGFDLANVLGNDMLAKAQLNEDGESHWYSHKWIWWTAGAVIATGAALAAAGGHSNNNTDSSSSSNQPNNCAIASGGPVASGGVPCPTP